MKRVLFDTNVVLDVLLDRQPWADASSAAWNLAETGQCKGLLAAPAVTTIRFLLQRDKGASRANHAVAALLKVFAVARVDGEVLHQALQFGFSDFEDAVTAAAAFSANCDYVATRDPKGFRESPVRSFTPEALIPLLTNP